VALWQEQKVKNVMECMLALCAKKNEVRFSMYLGAKRVKG